MLANGAKLEFKSKTVTTYTKLKGLKELPEIGVEPEKVENSDLDDTQKVYEMGIGDPGDITYKFKYDNTETDSPYRVLRKYEESGEVLSFKETLKRWYYYRIQWTDFIKKNRRRSQWCN